VPILVEPKYEGNIGSIARVSKNFGITKMIIVNPPTLGEEARRYSMHGYDLLKEAVVVENFEDARRLVDHCVGTSGVSETGRKAFLRNPISPMEMIRWARGVNGKVGLAFGREDFGLYKEELSLCDQLVTIEADPIYPIMNISHAAAVLLYLVWSDRNTLVNDNARKADRVEREALMDHYDRLLETGKMPLHKREIASVNFRRMISRASPNYREFYSMMGAFSRAMDRKRDRSQNEDRNG